MHAEICAVELYMHSAVYMMLLFASNIKMI